MSNPIVNSMIPQQRHTQKAFVNPREFSPGDWAFDVNRAQELNWRPGTADQSDYNHFTNNEPHQDLNISMFGMDSNPDKIYGFTQYNMPPNAEITNSHMSGYQKQKVTRVADNMNPFTSIMSAPPQRYPVNVWLNSYTGSMSRPRYN